MTKVGPFKYNISREFVNPIYDDAKKVVNYTMKHDYELMNPIDANGNKIEETEITMLNLDG